MATSKQGGSRASSRVRVVIVGVGAMGRRHARVFAALAERFEVVGVLDARRDVAAEVAQAFDTVVIDDAAEAIARADLVVIATPMLAHASTAAAAMERGRHVLIEKPICARSADAHALVALATRAGKQLFVGHSERFNPVVRALVRLIRRDEAVAIDFRRVGATVSQDGGVLMNLGVHDFDLAAYLTGSRVEARGAVGHFAAGSSHAMGEDLAHVVLAAESGAAVHVHVDRTVATKQRLVVLTTSRWVYEGDLLAQRLTRFPRAGGARSDVPLRLEEPLVAQALAIANALGGRERSAREVALGADGARALELAEIAAAEVRAAMASGVELVAGE